MELIDIGANLTHASFTTDLDAVLGRAHEAGVSQIIVTGTSVAASHAADRVAKDYPGFLFATAGVHPHEASGWSASSADVLEGLLTEPNVVAVGEAGLDFNRNYSPRDAQEEAFEAQLDLAARVNRPVFLHQRDAHDRFLNIVRRHRDHLGAAVVHCFTGDSSELADYLDLDLHVGITGWICDERRGKHLRELVTEIPLTRLMLETDSPYLLPRDLAPKPKSRRNEPMHLAHIADTVARCMSLPLDEFATSVAATTRAFFNLCDSPQTQAG